MEIERKFTVKELPDLSSYPYLILEQGYLSTEPVIRVRRENDTYYLTYKGKGMLSREEYNLPLTKSSYEHLLSKADGNIICKKRYLIPYLSYTIELDIFDSPFPSLIFLPLLPLPLLWQQLLRQISVLPGLRFLFPEGR